MFNVFRPIFKWKLHNNQNAIFYMLVSQPLHQPWVHQELITVHNNKFGSTALTLGTTYYSMYLQLQPHVRGADEESISPIGSSVIA